MPSTLFTPMLLSVNLVVSAPPTISNVWFNFLAITLDLSAPCASSPAYFMPSSNVATSRLLLFLSSYTIRVMPSLPFTPGWPFSAFMERPSLPSLPLRPMEPSLPLITTEEPSLPFTPILPSTPSLPSLPILMSSDNAYSTLAPSSLLVCFTVKFLPAAISTVLPSVIVFAAASESAVVLPVDFTFHTDCAAPGATCKS